MHILAPFTLLTCLLIAALTSADNTTSNLTPSSSDVVLSRASSLSASTTTLRPPRPPGATSLPLPIPSWELMNRHNWISVADGHPLPRQHGAYALPPASITPPRAMQKRLVPIPYIPPDWTTRVECPVIQGLPCATVSEYLPYLRGDENKAAEEAVRASELANGGAYVPGMASPAPSGVGKVEVEWFSYLLAVVCAAMFWLILVVL